MDNRQISVLLLLFCLTCAQYEVFIPGKGPRPTSQEGFDYSVSKSSNRGAKASTGQPASTDSLYPNAPVPIAYPPYQGDPSYPNQQQQIYPVIIPGNGTNSDEPVYLAMLPMQLVYQQYYQDQGVNYKPTFQENVRFPSVPYQNDPVYSNDPSYVSDSSYFATFSDAKDPSYPTKSSDPNEPSYQNDPSYPATPSYPNTTPYPATPPYPSTQSYNIPPNDPSTNPDDTSYPTYPSTTSYPKVPTYTSTSYPNTPAYPKEPASPNKSTYPETPKIPETPSSSHLDQSSNDYSFHGVKPPAKLYPCAGNSSGKKYNVQDVCFAYFECVNGESLYRQCDDHYRFDGTQCVPDVACLSACPDQMKPHPSDIYKFILGGTDMSCPYGTFFDYKICTCQSKNNLPKD